ncbi:PucR family transcriptional regulator [Glutamicibacter sp.]|uniref:PucR family transcriptional regulator n=1 Tax=Glutamicibacter sp. TaxID=1931995 RepID=UPI002B464FEC|nr:PucR family transcriptional regulator ligand-binding domain-containing protein [Glutamicibacter sp.]HJX80011.1 PucR family transcriptional regulator ligand-binding domain-containing protein [Glutamicibacter sp.]
MAINIAELLSEPQLGLSLLAGWEGIDRTVAWSHTSDLPNVWEWVSPGVLLMTNGLSIPADPGLQVKLAQSLVQAGAVALAVGEKMHAPDFSPEFLDSCNSLPLPLISVPYPLPFMAISRSIAEANLLEESRRIKQTARIYDLLRKATTPGETWTQLIEGISKEVKANLYVVDSRCLHPWQSGDPSLPEDLIARVRRAHAEVSAENKHFLWSGTGSESILLMEIPTHPHALLVVAPQSDTKPDGVILLHVATIVGLGLSRSALLLESLYRSGGEFLVQAFDGRIGTDDATRRLEEYGIPSGPMRVVTVPDKAESDLPEVHRALWRHEVNSICMIGEGKLHLLISEQCTTTLLLHVLDEKLPIGISSTVESSEIQRGVRESLWALGQAISRDVRYMTYSAEDAWFGLTNYKDGEVLVQRILGALIEHDLTHQTEFLTTLKAYLQNQRSPQKVASLLFVHRQTVIYRVRKISELTGLDLAESSSVAQLWMAVQVLEAMGLEERLERK